MGSFPSVEHQFKPGIDTHPPRPGKPKGHKNLSTYIQDYLDSDQAIPYKRSKWRGKPAQLIVGVMTAQAAKGDVKAADWLAKYGYGTKVDFTSGGEPIAFMNAVPRPQVIIEGEVLESPGSHNVTLPDQSVTPDE